MTKNYRQTLIACYMGFITQAVAANFAPLLFLTFHETYGISLAKIALISSVFFLTQLVTDLLSAGLVDTQKFSLPSGFWGSRFFLTCFRILSRESWSAWQCMQ